MVAPLFRLGPGFPRSVVTVTFQGPKGEFPFAGANMWGNIPSPSRLCASCWRRTRTRRLRDAELFLTKMT